MSLKTDANRIAKRLPEMRKLHLKVKMRPSVVFNSFLPALFVMRLSNLLR